ncbi:hypothetical protein CF328_g8214 [Tilletia controversa]|nr:hypothetical protein CF328_g8214 [Tilletia controversa]
MSDGELIALISAEAELASESQNSGGIWKCGGGALRVTPGTTLLDPTVPILKILLEDQAFVGIDTQDDLLNLSPAHLATLEDGQLELPLRSEYSETCLFRAVRQASGSRSYVVSATRGLTYDRANRLRRAAAHRADFNDQEMVFYTLRRMVVSATNRTDVTSESAHLVVGHKLGTSTRF